MDLGCLLFPHQIQFPILKRFLIELRDGSTILYWAFSNVNFCSIGGWFDNLVRLFSLLRFRKRTFVIGPLSSTGADCFSSCLIEIDIYMCIYTAQVYMSTVLVTSERRERSSYQQFYMGCLDDIQTALKPLQKIGNSFKYIFMTILGLADSFKTMNRPGLAVMLLDGIFL